MQQSRTITRKSASNLALAFVLLPKAKRDGMSALYAFCREVDDLADNESVPVEQRRRQLAAWRADVRRACDGQSPLFAVNRELQLIIRQFHLPFDHFDALIQGVEMDLDIKRYATMPSSSARPSNSPTSSATFAGMPSAAASICPSPNWPASTSRPNKFCASNTRPTSSTSPPPSPTAPAISTAAPAKPCRPPIAAPWLPPS